MGGGEKKQGRKRLAAKERAEVVLEREEEGERGWRRRERERGEYRTMPSRVINKYWLSGVKLG